MIKNSEIWSDILSKLEAGEKVMLLIVADAQGHTPGKPGFKLVLHQSDRIFGTIGGGLVEYEMIEKAKTLIGNMTLPVLEEFSMMHTLDDGSGGMICGGKQTVLFFPFLQKHEPAIRQILDLIHSHKTCLFEITQSGNFSVKELAETINQAGLQQTDSGWKYTEPGGTEPVVHIVGGGHVSLALSQILSFLGYYIIVYDERSEAETFVNNTFANEKKCLPYGEVYKHIEESDNTFILIMTPGHKQDELVLRSTISRNVRYIGLMASRKKRNEIIEKMLLDGFSEKQLEKLYSPVGLSIGSTTPAEIAISIAGEMISVIRKK